MTTWNLSWTDVHGHQLPSSLCVLSGIASFESSSSKSVLYHGHSQVKWTCLSVSTVLLKLWLRSAVRVQHANCAHTKFSCLPSLLIKSVFTNALQKCRMRRWGRTSCGPLPSLVFLVLPPLLLSHAKLLTLAIESRRQAAPSGPVCRQMRLPVWAQRKSRREWLRERCWK